MSFVISTKQYNNIISQVNFPLNDFVLRISTGCGFMRTSTRNNKAMIKLLLLLLSLLVVKDTCNLKNQCMVGFFKFMWYWHYLISEA